MPSRTPGPTCARAGRASRSLLLACALAVAAGCGDGGATAPAPRASQTSGDPQMLECPTSQSRTASGIVGPLGGTVEADGLSISVPLGAVLLPTQLTLTVPASNYVEVDITANGANHFEFLKPVSVTVSYARCTRSDIEDDVLSVWYIDGESRAFLEHMGGVDDKVARTVTFSTGHLSSYVVAN